MRFARIITSGGPGPALAAKSATTIPIVFAPIPDPVRSGLVESLNRPGGNVTGVAALTIELDPKRWNYCTKASATFSTSRARGKGVR
jgi:putative tryptophan/tyrosine transport system substrate-binding protein